MRGKGGANFKLMILTFCFSFSFSSFPLIGWAIRPTQIKLALVSLVLLILITLPGIALTTLGK